MGNYMRKDVVYFLMGFIFCDTKIFEYDFGWVLVEWV